MIDMKSPTAKQLRKARSVAGLTRREAAQLIGVAPGTWRNWEQGVNPMPGPYWELFRIKNEAKSCKQAKRIGVVI